VSSLTTLFLFQTLKDLYGIEISHLQVANYARIAALVSKPFVDNYEYPKSSVFTADKFGQKFNFRMNQQLTVLEFFAVDKTFRAFFCVLSRVALHA
jgi:hypothetical protein